MLSTLAIVALLSAIPTLTATSLAGRTLVPAKRAITLETRDLWRRHIVPKESVQLNYAISTYHPPSASVSFTAHDGRPLLLLEDLDHLLENVLCCPLVPDEETSIMKIRFHSSEAFTEALGHWGHLAEFTVITAHPSCNIDNEHGAWTVVSTDGDFSLKVLMLTVRSIPMNAVGRSCRVKYEHSGSNKWDARDLTTTGIIHRRDEHSNDQLYSFGYSPDLSSPFPLFPPPNATLISDAIQTQLQDVNIQLSCINCVSQTNLSIGVDFDIDLGDASCFISSTENCFTLNRAAMNFTVQDFEQSADLELVIGGQYSLSTDFDVLKIPIEPAFTFGSFIDIGPAFGLAVGFDLDIPASLNVSYGAKAQVPSGAFASVSFINETGGWDPSVDATGWDATNVVQVPFRVNSGEFNVSTSVSMAAFVEVAFTIMGVGASARVTQNVPAVNINAVVHNAVNRACKPIGADDFESFGTAFAVGAGLELGSTAHFEVDTGEFFGTLIPADWDFPIWSHEIPLAPAQGINTTVCFVLSDDATVTTGNAKVDAVTLAGVPAATGTMFPAASAVPTWDIPKIESYYSANGHLPTNVNYNQMAQATTIPDNLQTAIAKAAKSGTKGKLRGASRLCIVLVAISFGSWFI
ncbi:hypothetical protein PHLCEN_2v9222 [Hermanssonia centrifuga]|uniref:Uncharacterized protein n=1 Tax=Hermanssonia centrifuga TaxID=98765 RepID=A0A2R6NRG0_9APHY|nr:hypothetical protein PHLCEN_2v9222 [Hermanssonia centrifuga]